MNLEDLASHSVLVMIQVDLIVDFIAMNLLNLENAVRLVDYSVLLLKIDFISVNFTSYSGLRGLRTGH